MSSPGKARLGKGLGALLGDYLEPQPESSEVSSVATASIVPNPLQPRKEFSKEELAELTSSIRENGLLQPLVVRRSPGRSDRYELVAGERRFRAVSELGYDEVPVVVRDVDDETLLVLALVENLQREALNPLEEAEGYKTLADRFGMTQAEIARSVGKDRSTVANLLRLLRLPPSVRKLVQTGSLSAGHARALLPLDEPVRMGNLARQSVREGWSVREMERRVGTAADKPKARRDSKTPGMDRRDPIVRELEEGLREVLATRVVIRGNGKGKGTIEIPFHDPEDFERVFALITGREVTDWIS